MFFTISVSKHRLRNSGKKYPGQTARICDKQHSSCDEWLYFLYSVTNDYPSVPPSISVFISFA